MTKLTAAAALSLAIASTGASAIQIDFTGNANIGSSIFRSELSMLTSSSIISTVLDPGGLSTSNAGTLYIQGVYDFQGDPAATSEVTWTLVLPVTTSLINPTVPPVSALDVVAVANTGTFSMFIDAGNDANALTGTGYSNGTPIASGNLTLSGAFQLIVNDLGVHGALDSSGIGDPANPAFAGYTSSAISGSANVNVDITSKDDNYIVSALDALDIDMTLQNIAYTAPYTSPNTAATAVVGYSAFLGSDADQSGVCVNDGSGSRIDGTAIAAGTFCDLQAQVGGNTKFFDERVPEPTSLALLGIALSAFGISRRRKNV